MFMADRPNPSLVHTVSTRHLPATKRSFPNVNYMPLFPCGELQSLRCSIEPHRGLVPPRSFEIRYTTTDLLQRFRCLSSRTSTAHKRTHTHIYTIYRMRTGGGGFFKNPIDSLFRPPFPPVSMIESKPCPKATSNLGYPGPWPVRSWLPRESRPRTPSYHVSQAR